MNAFSIEEACYLEEALRVRRLHMWYTLCSKYLIPDDLQKDVIEWIMSGIFEEKVLRRKKPPVKVSQYKLVKVLKKHVHTPDVLHHC
jgi:hypothetical protein